MTTRRPIQKSPSKRTDPWFVVLGVLSVLALISLFIWGQREGPQFDSDRCPRNVAPTAQVVVLLDPSDSLSSVQKQSVVSRLLEDLENVPEQTEIRVYTVARAGRRELVPEVRTCMPPHPDSVGTLESLKTNRVIMEREYAEGFRIPLEQRLQTLLDVPSDTVSLIVEAVQASVVDAFQPRNASILRRVLIVSDMVQHSPDLSFFRQTPDFGAFARNPNYGTLRVDLSSVEVTVFLLARRGIAGRVQAGQLKVFWEDYFLDQGVKAAARPRWVDVEG